MSVAPGGQEKHGYKSLLKIDLRRELDPPKFSKKPENVAFRGVSCMQMDAISSRTSRGDRSTGPAGSRLRDQLGPQDQAGFNTRIFVSDKSGMAGGPAGDSQRAPSASASDLGRRLLASTSATPEL
jgi:hypothetical protein